MIAPKPIADDTGRAAQHPLDEGGQPVSALFELLPHVVRTLRREPALAITLVYLLVAMAGIFYDYSFYRQFDVPVLTLSQISDFLVAGIQQPMAIVLVVSTFPLCWLFDRINLWGRRRRAAEGARLKAMPRLNWWQRRRLAFIVGMNEQRGYMRVMYAVIIVAYAWTFVSAYAGYRADAVKNGEAPAVLVWLNGASGPLGTAPQARLNWTYLGAISQYVFLYDPAMKRAAILPVNGIARIEPIPSPEKPGGHVVVAPIL